LRGYLLDTNVLSELRKRRPNSNVVDAVARIPEPSLYVSVITLGELRLEIELLARGRKRLDLERWLVSELPLRFADRVLPFDREAADRWGSIEARARRSGHKIPSVDGMLAATALVFELAIVTRNTRDFSQTQAPVFNPWSDTT